MLAVGSVAGVTLMGLEKVPPMHFHHLFEAFRAFLAFFSTRFRHVSSRFSRDSHVEEVGFLWYAKRISPWAALGFALGLGTYQLQRVIIGV